MTEMIFGFLEAIGFTHPVHPAFTHIPMGMGIGAVVFRLLSLTSQFKFLGRTGYHCIVLGLLGVFPTVFTGYLDWIHRYGGDWEFLIILKMFLAMVLTGLFLAIFIMDKPDDPKMDRNTLLYLIVVLVSIGLGYSGGELQYG